MGIRCASIDGAFYCQASTTIMFVRLFFGLMQNQWHNVSVFYVFLTNSLFYFYAKERAVSIID